VAVVAAVLAACTGASPTSTTTSASIPSGSSTSTSAGASTTALTLPEGTEELPEGLRMEIARLIPLTEDLRELNFVSPPTITVISADELSERVIQQVEEEYEDVGVDEALYRALGLTPQDFDLLETLKSLYGEQVAGYYDGDTKELVVTARNEEFTPLEESTLVHELTHSLTDQVHSFNDHFNELFDNDRFDEGSAFQSVVEGDATLVETLFAQQLSFEDQQPFLEEAFGVDSSVFDAVPKFMQDSLIFPYREGAAFMQEEWAEGGFDAINELYQQPPTSSEQILHPEDYPDDPPLAVDLATSELPGYEFSYGSVWGELGFRLMFDQILGGAGAATEGWGGDTYDLYFNGSDVVLVLLYQGDEASDANELKAALGDYFQVAYGVTEPTADEGPGAGEIYAADNYAFVANVGSEALLIVASDPAAGATARGWYPEF
jgi:hypothetical protein